MDNDFANEQINYKLSCNRYQDTRPCFAVGPSNWQNTNYYYLEIHIEFPLQNSRFELFGSGPGEGCASLSNSARQRRHARGKIASYRKAPPPKKIRLISWGSMSLVSNIKLIRTETTLDLSQKAEKGMNCQRMPGGLYNPPMPLFRHPIRD